MNYDELVKALRLIGKEQDCNECEAGRWHHDFKCCLFEDSADAIEALQAEVEELKRVNMELFEDLPKYGDKILHWVSVKDGLPEIDKRVLVSYGGWTQIMSRRDDGDKICEKYWEDEEGLWERVLDDTYWMPLPEPPQEVQE